MFVLLFFVFFFVFLLWVGIDRFDFAVLSLALLARSCVGSHLLHLHFQSSQQAI